MNWKLKEQVFFDSYLITNGKSLFEDGYESKLVTYSEALEFGIPAEELEKLKEDSPINKPSWQKIDLPEVEDKPYAPPNKKEREVWNRLARENFKIQLMKDISFDLQVCLLEGWNPSEYISELLKILNHFKNSFNKKVYSNQISLFDRNFE